MYTVIENREQCRALSVKNSETISLRFLVVNMCKEALQVFKVDKHLRLIA